MPGQSAANCGRPSDWRAMGAGRLGLPKREASSGNDNVDKLGVSAREGITAVWKSAFTLKHQKHWRNRNDSEARGRAVVA